MTGSGGQDGRDEQDGGAARSDGFIAWSGRAYAGNPSKLRAFVPLLRNHPLLCPRDRIEKAVNRQDRNWHRCRFADSFDPDSESDPDPERILRTLSGCGDHLGPGPRVGLVPRPTRGYRLQRLRRWGVDGRECGCLRRGCASGVLVLVLVLEPMGSWDGVVGRACWFEYEHRPAG